MKPISYSQGAQRRKELAGLRAIARRASAAQEPPLWWECLRLAAFLVPAAWVLL